MAWWHALPLVATVADYIGRKKEIRAQKEIAAQNVALQKEFAQQGIRWRAEDARAAGLSPLVAVGSPGASFSPYSIGDSGAGEMARLGQNIARAGYAGMSEREREKSSELQLEHLRLQNELLASQIARLNGSQMNPGMPWDTGLEKFIPGQGGVPGPWSGGYGGGVIDVNPSKATVSQPGRPAQEAGSINDFHFARTQGGGLAPVTSADIKQRVEDQPIQEFFWSFRNQFVPTLQKLLNLAGQDRAAPDPKYYPLPEGYDRWAYDPLNQEYRPARSRKGLGRFVWREEYK